MRLDKFMANLNIGTRSEVKRIIRQKEVIVNSTIAKADYQLKPGDTVFYKGQEFPFIISSYILVNKPQGYICANSDNYHQTVFDLLPDQFQKSYHICGRLDIDTTGLVLISNDGAFTHQVISPNKKLFKTYIVTCEKEVSDEEILILSNPIELSDFTTKGAIVQRISSNELEIKISEGKYHQIKRMVHHIDNEVIALHRECIGGLCLNDIQQGEYLILNDELIKEIFNYEN